MEVLGVVAAGGMGGAIQGVLGFAVLGGVLCHELPVKLAGLDRRDVNIVTCAKKCTQVLACALPEIIGLFTVLTMACFLRLRGDTEVIVDPHEKQVWEEIKQDWPILMGADTLLNLQAMLRLIVLLFLSLRAKWSGSSPLTGMSAIFLFSAMVARGSLSTQTRDYRLEGPLALGGDLPIACEAAMIPFLATLGVTALREMPITAISAISMATAMSQCHYLNLARNPSMDSLFILAHLLELLSAFAFVARTISICFSPGERKSSTSVGFMQFIMPIQQALSTYYFLTAFGPDANLVGRGRPFCILIIGSLLQLGAYLCAAAIHFGVFFEAVESESGEVEIVPQVQPLIDQAENVTIGV
eukprot:TRINITY_DN89_c8_g1_i1.p1 TRINITY_DN89_c8_g1~~TRINITY_DN89_c8_g1_i1.p1  ORF type:complete len:357 (-),score=55.94 TRINITY_DN89_c8_g1_i1:454-1524(-)